jgi:hypothetical protein
MVISGRGNTWLARDNCKNKMVRNQATHRPTPNKLSGHHGTQSIYYFCRFFLQYLCGVSVCNFLYVMSMFLFTNLAMRASSLATTLQAHKVKCICFSSGKTLERPTPSQSHGHTKKNEKKLTMC